ncbi:MAG: CD1247 N-terminal domain-containing protein [Bacillota bacterium]|jgi:phage FluMu protein Com
MKDLKQKVSYLQGLAEGMEISKESKEGKLISHIIEVLEGVAYTIDELRMQQDELEEYLETIDDDLNDLEEDFYVDEDDDNTDYVEVKCPKCNDIVCFDSSILEDEDLIEVTCPRCNEVVFINDGSYDEHEHEIVAEGINEVDNLAAEKKEKTVDL